MHPLSAGVVDLLRKGSLPADHWDWHWGSGFTWEREEEGEAGAGLTGEQQIEAKQQARQQAQQQGGSRSPCRGRRRATLAARLLGRSAALPGPAGPAGPHRTARHGTAPCSALRCSQVPSLATGSAWASLGRCRRWCTRRWSTLAPAALSRTTPSRILFLVSPLLHCRVTQHQRVHTITHNIVFKSKRCRLQRSPGQVRPRTPPPPPPGPPSVELRMHPAMPHPALQGCPWRSRCG